MPDRRTISPRNDQRSQTRQGAREVVVDENGAGQRIDNFLMTRLKGLPRARIYRCLRRGEVRVNSARIRQHYRLKPGDVVRIPPLRLGAQAPATTPNAALIALVADRVIFEDRALIVLDKPSGVAVHGGSGRSYGIIEALRAARGTREHLELVHRLDRDTSGCLMVAKRRAVLTGLHAQLRRGEVEKRYSLLVAGRWRGGARTVQAPLRKNVARSGERVVTLDEHGRQARTRFRPLAVSARASLLEAVALTGRTHQIRVHAASLGHFPAGDAKYGDRAFNRELRALGLRRLFLHAESLRFANPRDGAVVEVAAPLPDDLRAVLAELGLDACAASRP
ncbi:MAG: RluA family pseudouridine synthase [Gammaproteobacteria bacterium]|nr:RluA family pseudouridine synthase [Gammaproteobacteria bacterium]